MSWVEELYRTYENNAGKIGDRNEPIALLPICHTTQKAHINIVLDGDGNFLRASVVSKADARTIIPATEDSAGRTSGTTPHPLCDKLQYVAADYKLYGGEKEECFGKYYKLLSDWVSSEAGLPKLNAVFAYIKKGRVVADLVETKVLYVNTGEGQSNQVLVNQWKEVESSPEIFKLLSGGFDNKGKSKPWQADAFVRWSVEIPGDPQADLWTDKSAWDSWKNYYISLGADKGICQITGEEAVLAIQHPAKIRNDGDKAKLISSNDSSGFTYRGRFTTAGQACGVSFDVTQKAHSALRWLVARQGYRDGDQAVVAWAVSGVDIPDPFADSYSLLFGRKDETAGEDATSGQGYTRQEVGIQLAKRIAGYSAELGSTEKVVVIGLDSATTGRLAIAFYRELTGSELLERVLAWHSGCCWLQKYGKGRVFIGAPAPRDIAEAAYGRRLDDKLRKATVERLLPCIVDGATLPRDLVESCIRRASNRNGLEGWEWEKALGIACALFSYIYRERSYSMSLERERNTRDYLYGRLLALAERTEEIALNAGGEKRETNAGRLMQRFSDRPYSTWLTVETSLTPYKVRLRTKRAGFLHNIEKEIDDVMCMFDTRDFTSDQRLSGEFLLGFHCQRADLRTKPTENSHEETEEEIGNEAL